MQEQNAGSAATGSLTLFFNQLKAGDPSAAEGLWASFFPRLLGLARKVLSGRPQRISDAEDAAQSAFASFCLRVQAGEYSVFDRNEMWKLLSVITANKARMQVRRELAEKRGGGRVTGEDALLNSEGNQVPLANLAIAQAAEFDCHCEELIEQLEPGLRQFALLRLLGYRNQEIAVLEDCTVRKVERKLNLIRLCWQAEWPG
jgi:DNA-directed RNA polymerase specialized sigma24 family protein